MDERRKGLRDIHGEVPPGAGMPVRGLMFLSGMPVGKKVVIKITSSEHDIWVIADNFLDEAGIEPQRFKLEWIAGERRTETVHREHGCVFRVDLEHCYFSPRLSHERMRIAQLVQQGEVVVNMFSGVGCFSVVISAHSRPERVYSIDVNPVAVKYLKENARLNKAERTIVPILGDAKEVIRDNLQNSADRVLMPLPEKAYDYLEYAISALKPNGGHINYYDFEHAKKDEDPIKKIEEKVSMKLRTLNVQFVISDSRIVRSVGPNWHQMVLDIRVSK